MECDVCHTLVWRYDFEKHMSSEHPDQDCPSIVSAAEKEILTKKSKNSKKNLKISELQKLSDDALKLFPLKDFWDSSKKDWAKGSYGVFVKQQSSRIKLLFGEENFN